MTELGLLPEEWKNMPLVQLMQPRIESVLPESVPDKRYVGLEHIDSGDAKIRRWGNTEQVRSAKSRFYPGDILYGKLRPYLDKAALAEWEGVCSTDILVFTSCTDTATPGYLSYLLHIKPFLDHAIATTSGVNHPRTSWSSLSKFTAPIPPLPEQKAIAGVLSAIQKSIETQDKTIAAARELKKSLMRHLFIYGPVPVAEAELVPLKETEIGPVPEHWAQKELGQISDIIYGVQAAVANLTDSSIGIPILTNINIRNEGMLDISTLRYYPLPENKRDRLVLRKGDVLFNWRSGSPQHVGKTAIFDLDGDYTFSSFILRFRANLDIIGNEYLFRYLNFLKSIGFFTDKRSQSSVNSVFNASLAAKIPIFLPPASDQTKMVVALASADRKLEIEENRKAAIQSLFKTMLHHLLSGKVRVKDTEVLHELTQ